MQLLDVTLLSLQTALVATVGMAVPAFFVASYLVRNTGRVAFVLDLMVSMPLALPPVAVGFILLWFFGATGPLDPLSEGLAFSWVAMSIASAVVSFPLVVRAFVAGLGEVDPRLVFAARNLGAGRLRATWDVILPLAKRGIAAGLLLGFVRSFAEFGATIVFAGNIPGSTQGLPSAIFSRISAGDFSEAWLLAAVSIVIGGIALAVHNRLVAQQRNRMVARSGSNG